MVRELLIEIWIGPEAYIAFHHAFDQICVDGHAALAVGHPQAIYISLLHDDIQTCRHALSALSGT